MPQMTMFFALFHSAGEVKAAPGPNIFTMADWKAMSRSGRTLQAPMTVWRCCMTDPSAVPPPRTAVLPLPKKKAMDSGPNSSV